MMKWKFLTLLALSVCTVIVIGTEIARATFTTEVAVPVAIPKVAIPKVAISEAATTPTSTTQQEPTVSPEVEAVNQAALDYLRQGQQTLPQSPNIRRTVINEGYALATWSWGEAGGQTVLSFTDETWTVLSSGGGAVNVSDLEAAGVPTEIAEQLLENDQAGG